MKDYELIMLEYLMQLKHYDDGSYEKALNFCKKATKSGIILIKTVRKNLIPASLTKKLRPSGKTIREYQRYEIIGDTHTMYFGCRLPVNIVIYELR